jgi:hypothetical protein
VVAAVGANETVVLGILSLIIWRRRDAEINYAMRLNSKRRPDVIVAAIMSEVGTQVTV